MKRSNRHNGVSDSLPSIASLQHKSTPEFRGIKAAYIHGSSFSEIVETPSLSNILADLKHQDFGRGKAVAFAAGACASEARRLYFVTFDASDLTCYTSRAYLWLIRSLWHRKADSSALLGAHCMRSHRAQTIHKTFAKRCACYRLGSNSAQRHAFRACSVMPKLSNRELDVWELYDEMQPQKWLAWRSLLKVDLLPIWLLLRTRPLCLSGIQANHLISYHGRYQSECPLQNKKMVSKPIQAAIVIPDVYAPVESLDEKPCKIRRITRACDYCHRRSIKCRARETPNDKRCQNCFEFAQACTYDRPIRRRGAKKRSPSSEVAGRRRELVEEVSPVIATNPLEAGPGVSFTAYGHARVSKSDGPDWRAPDMANQAMIMDLVEIYFEIIYPL